MKKLLYILYGLEIIILLWMVRININIDKFKD